MRLNPIIKKDIKVQSRSMRICWGVFAYELILALVFFLAMMYIQRVNRYSNNNIYSSMVWLYPILAVTQLIVLGVVVPIRTASSISGEKECQTFDIMMTTGMTPFSIIIGKISTAILQSMLFVVGSMPIMALPFIIGGMSWSYLFWFLAIALLDSFFAASIGILCSSICRKSISAVIMSYGFYLIFFLATLLPYIINTLLHVSLRQSVYDYNALLFLLLNPAVYILEFFVRLMSGESFINSISNMSNINGPIRYVTVGYRWMIVSTLLFVAVSLLFLLLAARRIDPIRGHAGNKEHR